MANVVLTLSTIPGVLAVCRLGATDPVPEWAWNGSFCSVTRTVEELSVICAESAVPAEVKSERGWRALKLEGPFDFSLVGVLAAILDPLAAAGVSILAVGTYDTDYVLVHEGQLERALTTLQAAGHTVRRVRSHK